MVAGGLMRIFACFRVVEIQGISARDIENSEAGRKTRIHPTKFARWLELIAKSFDLDDETETSKEETNRTFANERSAEIIRWLIGGIS